MRLLKPYLRSMTMSLAVLLFTALASAACVKDWNYAAEIDAVAEKECEVLKHMGFEDFSEEAASTLKEIKSDKSIHKVHKKALAENANRWGFITDIRELTVLAIASLKNLPQAEQDKAAYDLIALTSNRLLPFPLLGLEAFEKNKVYGNNQGEKAKKKRDKYLQKQAQKRYLEEKSAIISIYLSLLNPGSDVAELLKSKNPATKALIKKLDKSVSKVLEYQYKFSGVQQTLYFGRALAIAMVRHARLTKQYWIESEIRGNLLERNEFLSNYITNNLTFVDRNNKASFVTVHSGDIANEYSTGSGAFQIAVGVKPTAKDDAALAHKLKLIASEWNLPLFLSDTNFEKIQAKMKANIALTEQEEEAWNNLWNTDYIRGFSHAGFVEVKKDLETGIQMVWIWDIYPFGDFGGMRQSGFEGFAHPEKYNRIGFVKYDAKKALAGFKEQIAERGYMNTVWDSYGSKIIKDGDEDYDVEPVLTASYKWPSKVDEATVKAWTMLDENQADDWFNNDVVPRALKMARSYMTGKNALVFSKGFYNMEGAAYCSQMVTLAFLQGANFDLQMDSDRYSTLAKISKKLSKDGSDLVSRIVSPTGFAWQSNLVDSVYKVDHSRDKVYAQINNHPKINGKPTVVSQNLELFRKQESVKNLSPLLQDKLQEFEVEDFDVDDDDI